MSELYPLASLPSSYYVDREAIGLTKSVKGNPLPVGEKPAADAMMIDEAQEYYDSISKREINFDLSPYIEIDPKQMKINQEAAYILIKNIKSSYDYINFDLGMNMLLDPFKENNPIHKPMDPKQEALIRKLGNLLEQRDMGQLSAKENIELEKALRDHDAYNKEHENERFYYYSGFKHYTQDTAEEMFAIGKQAAKNGFINIFQLNKDFVESELFQVAYEQWLGAKSKQPFTFTEHLKTYTAAKGNSRLEWLELFENNAQILRDHIYREDFDARSPLAKQELTDAHALAESILSDAYEIWGVGSELNVLA